MFFFYLYGKKYFWTKAAKKKWAITIELLLRKGHFDCRDNLIEQESVDEWYFFSWEKGFFMEKL